MLTVTKRDLNQHTAQVLDTITSATQYVVVTERGVPTWRIERYEPEDTNVFDQLTRTGKFTPAKATPRPWTQAAPTSPERVAEIDRLVADMRGDY